ncbi:MAG TPA: hypothetical protein VKH37_08095, partial [Ferruginibacter sp.]|nr:hypothetical protein [Ferruginibacter sp.]
WATILNEDGGSNFTPGTGEYTISVAGFYSVNASVNWLNYSTANRARLNMQLNGADIQGALAIPSPQFGTLGVHFARRFNVGDKIRFVVSHASTNPETIDGGNTFNTFDISLIHR